MSSQLFSSLHLFATRRISSAPKFFRYILGVFILAVVYIVAAKFGLSLAFFTKQVTTVWPPTGIALAALFLFGYKFWPGVLIGAFVANFLTAEPPLVAFGIAVGNTLEAITGSYLLKRFKFNPNFNHLRDVISLVVLAGFISTAISATIGVFVLIAGGLVSFTNFLRVWQVWWIGDMLGNLVMAPVILTWSRRPRLGPIRIFWLIEGVIFISILAGICWLIFFTEYNFYSFGLGPYVIFPLLIWAGLRFSQREVSSVILVISGVAIWGTLHGVGPFGLLEGREEGLFSLQLFIAVVSTVTMLLAAVIAEREGLERDLEKFKLAVDNESDHVMITDKDGVILYVNKAAEIITGYRADEVVGKTAGKVWGGHMPKEFYKKMWRVIDDKQKKPFAGEVVNHRKNGEAYAAEIRIAPILDKKGEVRFFVGVERDVTKLKEAEQVKTDFISFASHQLRTPLTVIKWNTEMLRSHSSQGLTLEQKKYLTEIERGEKRMALLINSLLNISRLEAAKIKIDPKPTDMIKLVSSVIYEVNSYASAKNCAIIFNKSDQSPLLIDLDVALFRQILVNLLNNATHYSKPKKCKIEVDFKEVEEYYQIDVVDDGIGIPANAQSKIFDKFFRADNAIKFNTEGTGLGLYMIKLIIERSGGKIWFESTEGKGSAFHFTIPKTGMKKTNDEK
jgi:PAS domain S-box-containing protein